MTCDGDGGRVHGASRARASPRGVQQFYKTPHRLIFPVEMADHVAHVPDRLIAKRGPDDADARRMQQKILRRSLSELSKKQNAVGNE